MGRIWVISKRDFQTLYSNNSKATQMSVLDKLGPLQQIFMEFCQNEQSLAPLEDEELLQLFDTCSDPNRSTEEILAVLKRLSPSNGKVGFRQVNLLVDHLRERISLYAEERGYNLRVVPHDHSFGSGGDFRKTIHATTAACIIAAAAPWITICKTGTSNVTSHHGSFQAISQIGYKPQALDLELVNDLLENFRFAFVSLASLGFPYSDALKQARKALWDEAVSQFRQHHIQSSELTWPEVLRTTSIPLDVFKIVSPNAQVLNPVHHSTGVCYLGMMPYVLSTYLHLGSTGLITHSYDGIDEISNASSEELRDRPNNLMIKVEADRIVIAEFSPEDIDLTRADLQEIEEETNIEQEAETFWRIISSEERGPKRDFIVANAALLFVANGERLDTSADVITQLKSAVHIVEDLIDSGKAHSNFKKILSAVNKAPAVL